MTIVNRRLALRRAGALALAVGGFGAVAVRPRTVRAEGSWPDIRASLFDQREIADGKDMIGFEAPARALDAAIVPMTIKLAAAGSPADTVKTIWLVIDENPAPVAAVFHLHDDPGAGEIQTRVRVNAYTPVHVVAETADGRLLGVERFVKAAGGCSAPALKDPSQVEARLGKMKLRELAGFTTGRVNQVQLLVSHPQYTGMQIDQVSRAWIPPDYISKIQIAYAGKPVMDIDGDISLSEDPSLTFGFTPAAPGPMSVTVEDSKGRRFEQSFPLGSGT